MEACSIAFPQFLIISIPFRSSLSSRFSPLHPIFSPPPLPSHPVVSSADQGHGESGYAPGSILDDDAAAAVVVVAREVEMQR